VTALGRQGVVLSGTGGVWRVQVDDGDVVEASLRGRVKGSDRRDDQREAPGAMPVKLAVGDRVVLDDASGGSAIAAILPRRSRLARRAPGGAWGERILAANVDQVIVVLAAAQPEPHPRMLDRFLVIAEANDLPARVVVNKVDLVPAGHAEAAFAPYQRIGYPVHFASVARGTGLSDLVATLAGRVSVLTGPSGVGKSSLLNTMFPGLNLRVGEISQSVNKGRHTTVGGLMVPLPDGQHGYVVDTPGLREVGLWGLPSTHLDRCFPEFREALDHCRFGDCRHVSEPECGVRDAMARGAVTRDRYESYLHLLEELETERR
jgi:ribosome biogenesis GTPase / thiamine phosphate phosphatase